MSIPFQAQLQSIISNPDFLKTSAGQKAVQDLLSSIAAVANPALTGDTLGAGATVNINVLNPTMTTADVQDQSQAQAQLQKQLQQQQQQLVNTSAKATAAKKKKKCCYKKVKVCCKSD